MNNIRIYGGLGNQMFQYALGKVIKANGIDVAFDISARRRTHGGETAREYQLGYFNTRVKLAVKRKQRVIRDYTFTSDVLQKNNHTFWGYWQYTQLYDNVLPLLRNEFCVRKEYYTSQFLGLRVAITNEDSISIHVRRGDYVTNDGFNVLPLSYYIEALKYVKGTSLYIFSDDLAWCQKNFTEELFPYNITFVKLADYLDFELMKLCKCNIIANSTFSWWAAFLNNNEDKIVVAPIQWRERENDQKEFTKLFRLSNEWVVL